MNDGTNPTNPDTDGDGMCDGPNAVGGVCTAGPDAFPLDPSADTDTDGDGMPDTIDGPSTSVPPLVEDEDDDGDGLDDVNETDTGVYVDATDTGTDPLDPDTDNDGICDGPNAVPPICVAGPDDTPLGLTAEGDIYAVNNSVMVSLTPKYTIPDGTYEVHPALPAGLSIDPATGIISGTPTEVVPLTEYTVYGNATAGGLFFSFNLEVLEDTDGDGLPNEWWKTWTTTVTARPTCPRRARASTTDRVISVRIPSTPTPTATASVTAPTRCLRFVWPVLTRTRLAPARSARPSW